MIADPSARSAVLCIGRIYCDLIFTGLEALPLLGREVFAEGMGIVAGGGAFIAAAHIVHTGRHTALLSRLGTDVLSQSIAPQLSASGVDLDFIDHAEDAGPQVTVAAVVGHDRSFLSKRAGSALPATLDAALAWPRAGHLHIAEYATLAEIPDLVSRAKANGLTVSLDPSWDETLIRDPALPAKCAGVDIFLPNLEEAAAMTGETDPRRALAVLRQSFPVVALKAGSDGAHVAGAGFEQHVPAEDVPVVDTTGAGDAFNAGFIDAWLSGKSLDLCARAGIHHGSLAVQAVGGTSVLTR